VVAGARPAQRRTGRAFSIDVGESRKVPCNPGGKLLAVDGPRPHHPRRRQLVSGALVPPQVQGGLVEVHVLRLPGVELHHRLVVLEEQRLDEAHLPPRGAPLRVGVHGHRNVVPPAPVTGDDEQINVTARHQEGTVAAVGGVTGQVTFPHPVTFGLDVRRVAHGGSLPLCRTVVN
jgi:hypothetical protein